MSVLNIVRPLPINAIGGTFSSVTNLATPDPKEVASSDGAAGRTIDVDLGSVQTFDTLFLGYNNLDETYPVSVTYGAGSYTTTALGQLVVAASDVIGARRHHYLKLAAPVTGRYIRFTAAGGAAIQTFGVVAIGLAFAPTYGHEYGSGRGITDTGSATRLFGGGFGIDPGVRAGSWNWTMGDLTDAEVRQLYALALDRGETNSVLVVEDPDTSAGLNERIHWGLFSKLEPYERLAPGATRWGMRVDDWG